MNHFKFLTFLVLIFLFTSISIAQTKPLVEEKLSLQSGTIDNQFDYVIKKSIGWKDKKGRSYKGIKSSWMYELKTHTLDTLTAMHKDLTDTQTIVNAQVKEISNLKSSLSNILSDLDKTNKEKNKMDLFGVEMSKASYNSVMLAIVVGLFALLLLFIYKFKNSNTITKQAKQALIEIEEEFEEHRKIAVEREQKVRRKLQDELNKQKIN